MNHFLSCDWGTTTFRLCLVDVNDYSILAQEKSLEGIAATYNSWLETGDADSKARADFYLQIISYHIKSIEQKLNIGLKGVKIVISGMASSSIGAIEIPYARGPLAVNGSGFETALIPATVDFAHDTLIISGVRAGDDIMRGEETQLIGCMGYQAPADEDGLYIFPGTHSKHILVKDQLISGIKTYMTGEIFDLLSQKSILKNGVEPDDSPGDLQSFKKGVTDALSENLLQAAFKVRTNHLFSFFNKKENFQYLSGLLIGSELKDLMTTDADVIHLVCGSNLAIYYQTALAELALEKSINIFPVQWIEEATIRGQLKIGRQLNTLA